MRDSSSDALKSVLSSLVGTLPNMAYWLQQEVTMPEQLLSPYLLTRGSLTLFFGAEDSFKTQSMCQLAVCLASGIPWLTYQPRKSKVVYLVMEGNAGYIVDRIMGKAEALGADPADIGDIRVQEFIGKNLDNPSTVAELRQLLKPIECDVLILDPVTYQLANDVRFSTTMTPFVQTLMQLAEQERMSVVIVIHTRKGAEQGDMDSYLGSKALTAAAATRIGIFRDKDSDTATMYFKARYAEREDPIKVRYKAPLLEALERQMTPRDKAKDAIMRRLDAEPDLLMGPLVAAVAAQAGVNEKTVRSAISDLQTIGKLTVQNIRGTAAKRVVLSKN